MKLSRRGLFGWLGALTGAAAVAKVAPALAEPRPEFKHVATNPDWVFGAAEPLKLQTPEEVLELLRQSPLSKATLAAGEAIGAEIAAHNNAGWLADIERGKRAYADPVRLSPEHGHSYERRAFTLADECDSCRAKPGSPELCADCLRRRDGEHYSERELLAMDEACDNVPERRSTYEPILRHHRYGRWA